MTLRAPDRDWQDALRGLPAIALLERYEVAALVEAARRAAAQFEGTDAPSGEALRKALAPFERTDGGEA